MKLFKTLAIVFFIIMACFTAQAFEENSGALVPFEGAFTRTTDSQVYFSDDVLIRPSMAEDYIYLSDIGSDIMKIGVVDDYPYPWTAYVYESSLGNFSARYFVIDPEVTEIPYEQIQFNALADDVMSSIGEIVDSGEFTQADQKEIYLILRDIMEVEKYQKMSRVNQNGQPTATADAVKLRG